MATTSTDPRTRAQIIKAIQGVCKASGIDTKTVAATCRTRFGVSPGRNFNGLRKGDLADLEVMLRGARRKEGSSAGASREKATRGKLPAEWKGEPRPLIVHENRALFWPLRGMPKRCGGGAIIHPDDPFLWVRGFVDQRYKVRQMTDAELETYAAEHGGAMPEPTPCTHRRMFREYEKRGLSWMKWEPAGGRRVEPMEQEPMTEDDAEAGATSLGDDWEIPKIDKDEIQELQDMELDMDEEVARMEKMRSQRKGAKKDAPPLDEIPIPRGEGIEQPAEAPSEE